MAVTHLSLGNQQLLEHVMLWASAPLDLVNANPLLSGSNPPGLSGHAYAARLENHLRRIVEWEAKLLIPLHIPAHELNGNFGDLSVFGRNLWDSGIAWRENSEWASWAIDDVWQLHTTGLGIAQKVRLLRSGVGAMGGHIPRVAGLAHYFHWSQEFLESRSTLARRAVDRSENGAQAVFLFYDSAERAALRMMRGVHAMNHYTNRR